MYHLIFESLIQMKTWVIALLAMFSTMAVQAQTVIDALYQRMDSNDALHVMEKKIYQDNDAHPTSYCHYAEFTVDAQQAQPLIDDISNSFVRQSSNGGYSYHQMLAGRAFTGDPVRVAYGDRNQYEVEFGVHTDRNYILVFVKDTDDTSRRHCYAMVWYEDALNDGVMRIVRYHIYGPNPAVSGGNKESVVYSQDGNVTIIRSGDATVYYTPSKEVKTDIDFMRRFGNLYSTFQNATGADRQTVRVGVVVNLVELCRAHHELLTANERSTCELSMQQLMQLVDGNDAYQQGMLQEAINAVKKK